MRHRLSSAWPKTLPSPSGERKSDMCAASLSYVQHEKTIRGLKTAWLEAGARDRDIILFLHGFPDVASGWEPQMNFFAANYHVIAPDIRGAGPSEKSPDLRRYAPDAVALDCMAVLAEVDPDSKQKIFIVGHDLGAVHAWHLAGLLKQRAAGLVIINGLTIRQMLRRWRMPTQLAKSWYMFFMQLPVVPELLVKNFPKKLQGLAFRLGGLPGFPVTAATGRQAMLSPLNQYRAFMREVPKVVARRRQRLSCPVLVLFGADDAFLTTPSYDEIAADARDLTVRVIPGNHWLHREDPAKVNGLIERFFLQSSAKSAKGAP